MDDLVISPILTIPATEIAVSFARAGGPGGQHVNKVESKVVLRWKPAESGALAALEATDRERLCQRLAGRLNAAGELLVTSQKTRDQSKNRADATTKFIDIVRAALVRPKVRKATRPSRGSRERRLQTKKRRADVKRDRKPPSSHH